MTTDREPVGRADVAAVLGKHLPGNLGSLVCTCGASYERGGFPNHRADAILPLLAAEYQRGYDDGCDDPDSVWTSTLAGERAAGAAEAWPCANYTAPVTCLSAPSSRTGRCLFCSTMADLGAAEVRGMVALTLVPVEVFGTDACCEHAPHGVRDESADPCESTGYGLCDAVEAWSDCNRASGHIYRVEDLPNMHRTAGDVQTIWVQPETLAFFARRFGEAGSQSPDAGGAQGGEGRKWSIDELDLLHDHIGLGIEWRASERRAELAMEDRP